MNVNVTLDATPPLFYYCDVTPLTIYKSSCRWLVPSVVHLDSVRLCRERVGMKGLAGLSGVLMQHPVC